MTKKIIVLGLVSIFLLTSLYSVSAQQILENEPETVSKTVTKTIGDGLIVQVRTDVPLYGRIPVNNAIVVISGGVFRLKLTGLAGCANFLNLPHGTYQINVGKSGFEPQEFSYTHDGFNWIEVVLVYTDSINAQGLVEGQNAI